MKKLIWTVVTLLLATTTQIAARNRGEEKVDSNRKISYISQSFAKMLVDNVTAIDQQSLIGNWKQVLIGPTEYTQVGPYDSAGIAESGGNILTLTITTSTSSWLPKEAGQATFVVPSQDLKIYFDTIAKANEPASATLEGNFFVIKRQGKSLKCGFVYANQSNLICVRSQIASYEASVIGFERIVGGR